MYVKYMQKQERQNKIRHFIETHDILRQDELVSMLADLGAEVTQASVSRDLLELGITKLNGKYVRIEDKIEDIFSVQSIITAGENLIVLKCGIGMASAAALKIDNSRINGIAGTIAGDDTIFVAVKNAARQGSIVSELKKLFKNG